MNRQLSTMLTAALLAAPGAQAAEDSGRWELGLGTRDTVTEPWHAEGLRLLGRRAYAAWALELDLYATPSTDRSWPGQDPYDWDPTQESYIDMDQLSGALLVDWGPGYDPEGPRWQIAPHALAGVELRRTLRRYPYSVLTGMSTIAVLPSPQWAGGPDLGLGLHLHAGPHLGVRLALMDRMRWSLEPEHISSDVISGEELVVLHDLTAILDLLVAF